MTTPENAMQVSGNEVRTAQTFYGLSTDAKPENPVNGDKIVQMDASKLLMYDAENETWQEWGASS